MNWLRRILGLDRDLYAPAGIEPPHETWIADLLEELRAPYQPAFERLDALAVVDLLADPAAKRRILEPFLKEHPRCQ